jgi:hypothetical protein
VQLPTMNPTPESTEAARCSTRIRAQIPIRLTSLDNGNSFSESCHTLVVNLTGCGIRLSRPLEAGVRVCLDELPHGQSVMGCVATCVSLGPSSKYWVVGVALDEPGNVWGIYPVPADWGEGQTAAPTAPALGSKTEEWPYRQFSSRGEFHPGRR